MAAMMVASAMPAFADDANGNSDEAQFCQTLTYPTIATDELPAFTNQGDCVSYFAQLDHEKKAKKKVH